MVQEQIEKLRTLQESYNDLADEVNVISNKIDNIQLPEIDTTELAKHGDDPAPPVHISITTISNHNINLVL